MKVIAIVLLVCFCVACGSKKDPQPRSQSTPKLKPEAKNKPEPKPELKNKPARVDCARMCKRTFIQCVTEVLVSSGKIAAKRMVELKEANVLHQVQQSGYKSCLKDCEKKRGFGADAAEINKCLGLQGCQPYADCVKKHIR